MQYKIIKRGIKFRVKYRGWSTLGIWTTHSWHGYRESIPNDYNSEESAQEVIGFLSSQTYGVEVPRKVIYGD